MLLKVENTWLQVEMTCGLRLKTHVVKVKKHVVKGRKALYKLPRGKLKHMFPFLTIANRRRTVGAASVVYDFFLRFRDFGIQRLIVDGRIID